MELADKIVLAHKGFSDRANRGGFRENSVEACEAASAREYIGIIEVDVRKSKDGILYCYHGTLLEYYLFLKFRKDFSELQRMYHVDALADILEVIPTDKIVFLDMKDRRISKEDILRVFAGKTFREVILGNKSLSLLDRFNGMPKQFVKMLNGNIFCNFYDLKKLHSNNYKYIEAVFPFQITRSFMQRAQRASLEFRTCGLFFFSTRMYWDVINTFGIQHVSSDFV